MVSVSLMDVMRLDKKCGVTYKFIGKIPRCSLAKIMGNSKINIILLTIINICIVKRFAGKSKVDLDIL